MAYRKNIDDNALNTNKAANLNPNKLYSTIGRKISNRKDHTVRLR